MKIIESIVNPLIKKFHSLSVKKYREQFSLFIIEGEKVVKESLKYEGLVDNLIVNQKYSEDYKDLINEHNSKTILVTDEIFKSLSTTVEPQHIMAVCKFKNCNLSELTAPNVLVLDHLQDPGNLGTIIRSAVASGFNNIILLDSVDPYNSKTVRSASGTIFFAKFYKTTQEEFIKFTKTNNYAILIAEANKQSIFSEKFTLPQKYALVIGNEGNGIRQEILNQNHTSLSIPMNPKVESLNAGVSASVLMFILSNKN